MIRNNFFIKSRFNVLDDDDDDGSMRQMFSLTAYRQLFSNSVCIISN